jgi:hypothetical protein
LYCDEWIHDSIVSHSKVVPVLDVAPIDSTHIRRGVVEDRRSLLFPFSTGRKPAPLLQNESFASSVCLKEQRARRACTGTVPVSTKPLQDTSSFTHKNQNGLENPISSKNQKQKMPKGFKQFSNERALLILNVNHLSWYNLVVEVIVISEILR